MKISSFPPIFPKETEGPFSFRLDNPIHTLLAVEGEVVDPAQVRFAYDKVAAILGEVKTKERGKRPEEKIKLVYEAIRSHGLRLNTAGNWDDPLFTTNLLQGRLDCDTSSFIVLAVGHELNWPVHLVHVPRHSFVRWDDGNGTRFNIDFGTVRPDSYYVKEWNLDQDLIGKGQVLKNLNRDELTSIFYTNRAIAKSKLLGKSWEAMEDYSRALKLRSAPSPEQNSPWRLGNARWFLSLATLLAAQRR